jgi:IS1 family transposase
MNKLSTEERKSVVAALVEGNSLRSVTRMTGVHRTTVMKLLCDLGRACSEYQYKVFRNLRCKQIQCDEIWSFTYAKERNCTREMKAQGFGDTWTWVAMCADSKLVPCWHVGDRSAGTAYEFLSLLRSQISGRFQLSTDSHRAYIAIIPEVFGKDGIDYATVYKIFGNLPETTVTAQTRYSPAVCKGVVKKIMTGNPDEDRISTSFIERQNLTMRMSMRRFTRLTNAFSKKVENLTHALSLHYMHYNFCRVHQSLRVTPAMEAGITDHVWDLEEIIQLL